MVNSPRGPASGWAERLTHGWMLGGILRYYSPLPFNIITGTTTKQATAQPPCAPSYSLSADGGLNPCTEALPGTVIGRNTGAGFDSFTLDARLSRTFALTERVKLEGILEAFNSLNHRNDLISNRERTPPRRTQPLDRRPPSATCAASRSPRGSPSDVRRLDGVPHAVTHFPVRVSG